MFRHEKSNLQFPRLVYQKSVSFKYRGGKSTRIYVLDWSTLDELATDRGVRLFPEKYLDWLTSMQFAVPHNYRREIRRCVRMAVLERERQLPFDTNIREMCMETAEKFIEVAFDLLADCPYDSEEGYYLRDNKRGIIKPALLYRFWDGQTGRGLPWFMSGLEDLDNKYFKNRVAVDKRPQYWNELQEFIDAVEESRASWDRVHCPEVDEPLASITETDNIGSRFVARKGVKVKPLKETPSPKERRCTEDDSAQELEESILTLLRSGPKKPDEIYGQLPEWSTGIVLNHLRRMTEREDIIKDGPGRIHLLVIKGDEDVTESLKELAPITVHLMFQELAYLVRNHEMSLGDNITTLTRTHTMDQLGWIERDSYDDYVPTTFGAAMHNYVERRVKDARKEGTE